MVSHILPTNFVHSSLCTCFSDYRIGSNFWKFYLIRTSFITLGEPVSLVKMFRLFRLEWILLVFRAWTQSVDVQHLYLLAGPACLFCPLFNKPKLCFLVLRYLVMNNFFKRDGYVDPTISLFQWSMCMEKNLKLGDHLV
jgi:hypothetical protein